MVLAVFAMGYNLAFGYTGLLSLGHALFLAAGVYAAALPRSSGAGRPAGAVAWDPWAGALAAAVGLLALRTAGVSFMIVTLMFAQAGYLTVLYFGTVITGGDEGFQSSRCQPQAAWL
jgi:branched-chain amino acid transport system permease protein